MKKIVLLCFLLMGVVGCIDNFLIDRPYNLWFDEKNVTIYPQKSVYMKGDTISINIVFDKNLNTEEGKIRELKFDEKNEQVFKAIFFRPEKYEDSVQILKNGIKIFQNDERDDILTFRSKGNQILLQDKVEIVFNKEGEYLINKLLHIHISVNHYQTVGYSDDRVLKVEP